MRALRRALTFVLALTGAMATHAHAQRSADVLVWSAPEGCPDHASIAREVDRLLGERPRSDAAMQVRATITQRDAHLALEIVTSTPEGDAARTIEGTSCEALAQAAALVIALAIDPDAVAATEAARETPIETALETPTETTIETPTERASELAAAPPDEPAPHDEPLDVHFVASAHATLGIGALASASPGAMLALGVRLGLFRGGPLELWASGSFLAEQRARLAEDDPRGGTFGLAWARLRGCVPLEVAPPLLELAPCVAIEGGAMWGRGAGVPIVRSGSAPWVALAVGAEARVWVVGPLAITVLADLQVPFVPPTFDLEIEGAPRRVHRAFDVAGLFGLGVLLRLP